MAYHWPGGLAMLADPNWRLPPHLRSLCHALMEVAAGRIQRLIVTMPPGHGKSTTISKYFPAWYMGRFPKARLLLSSYEAGYAESWGRAARETLQFYGPEIFGVSVKGKPSSAGWWETARHGGVMWATGVGGALTGKRIHGLIIDDPIKDAKEALSPVIRKQRWEWYRSTAYTRLEPGGWVIILMTRWHLDDLAGKCLELARDGVEDWTVLNFPAIAEEGDMLGRQPGEALWPERFPLHVLEKVRLVQGPYWWSALYQGRPSHQEGTLFHRGHFRYWVSVDEQPGMVSLGQPNGPAKYVRIDDCSRFVTADLAVSVKETADYFVACVWGITPGKDLLLLDLVRERLEAPKQIEALKALQARWNPTHHRIESVQYQLSLVQIALNEGLNAKACPARGSKFERAQGIAARFEAGMVYLPRNVPWLAALEDELVNFPSAPHDDQFYNFSMAADAIAEPEGRF